MDKKQQLIKDIENLLNNHGDVTKTSINIELLEFMSESDLKDIISSLLTQKDNQAKDDRQWLEQFKSQ